MTVTDECPKCGHSQPVWNDPEYWDEQDVHIPLFCGSGACDMVWTEIYVHTAMQYTGKDGKTVTVT